MNAKKRSGIRGFSLPEVTISVGIVSVIILPTLALLASGGRIHQVSVDRSMAIRIVESIVSDMETLSDSNSFHLRVSDSDDPHQIRSPQGGNQEVAWFFADQSGQLLESVQEAEFNGGSSPATDALYAIEIEIRSASVPGSPSVTPGSQSIEIAEVEIRIESPAVAAKEDRDTSSYITLVPMP